MWALDFIVTLCRIIEEQLIVSGLSKCIDFRLLRERSVCLISNVGVSKKSARQRSHGTDCQRLFVTKVSVYSPFLSNEFLCFGMWIEEM